MNALAAVARSWVHEWCRAWDRFWFTAVDPATLGMIRLFAGAMLFYTHAVWSLGLEDFFGPDAWVNARAFTALRPGGFAWSGFWSGSGEATIGAAVSESGSFTWTWWWWIDSLAGGRPWLLWLVHVAGLAVIACSMLGLYTRVTTILSFLVAVAYVNRVPGALFGLDQINCMLALYLAVGPSGAAYSLDNLLRRRRGEKVDPRTPRVGANIALRLIQLHMCVIYLFAGLAKLEGETWQNGTALWGAVANLEYQSLDATWMAGYPLLINALTQTTVFWETFYIGLVWPRLTRPIIIAMAVPLHLGIALAMGMITFGLIMILANFAFLSPALVRGVLDPVARRLGLGSVAS
ncbi:MAG: HTTM domain-containing protein [Pirellulales bacterium]|nr:HTTM domain-containing protein [Pirellulales bacterium]